MYLGRFIQGDEVPLTALADGEGGLRTQPTSPATWTVYAAGGAVLASGLMPALDKGRTLGLFRHPLYLGVLYPPGRYLVRVSWLVGTQTRSETSCFDVVAGGAPAGAINSNYWVARPAGDAILDKTDGGSRHLGLRPTP